MVVCDAILYICKIYIADIFAIRKNGTAIIIFFRNYLLYPFEL